MNNSRLVYSTESGKICPSCQKSISECTCKKKKSRSQTNIKYDGVIRVQREVKGRKGKTVTTVSAFQLADDELKNLATQLKRRCGTGGSVTEDDLIRGDHIYVRRKGLLYSHHGIYAEGGTVIHYKGADKEKRDPAVIITDIDNFLNGGKLRRRNYRERLPYSESLRIAREHLSKKRYSLRGNNCEHFATYCATGKKKSLQVRRVIGGIATITLAVTGTVIKKMITKKKVG